MKKTLHTLLATCLGLTLHVSVASAQCTTSANTWNDLITAGGAPCSDGTNCVTTDPEWTTLGVYGSEGYSLENVEAGSDYIFDMCSGFGAGAWIPEITILAPDGTTVDAWNGGAATGSSVTHGEQCALEWTASQSGTYTIIINEYGTFVGDAPSQADCATTLTVDNGNPTVTCGTNPAQCPACSVGVLDVSDSPVDLCPGNSYSLMTDGSEFSVGGFGLLFVAWENAVGGPQSGNPEDISFSLTGVPSFPVNIDSDMGGFLSGNSYPELEGEWSVVIFAYSDPNDIENSICANSYPDTVVINFLDGSDEACAQVGPCVDAANTYSDLNSAGGAPCSNGTECVATDPEWTTLGVYGSEAYSLDGVEAGYDYVFDMCSGFGAGAWIPEITIVAPDGTTIDAWNGGAATGSSVTHADQCSIEWTATQSGTYTIVVNEYGTSAGDAPAQVSCGSTLAVDNGNPTVICGTNPAMCPPAPANDECDGAVALTVNETCITVEGDVAGATESLAGCLGTADDDVWFSFVANSTDVTVEVTGSANFDAVFEVFAGSDCGGLTPVTDGCVDATLSGETETKLFMGLTIGNTYYVRAYHYFAAVPATTTFDICVHALPVGIVDVADANLSIFPNPSNGQFTVQLDGVDGKGTINVMDMTGRNVFTQGVNLNGAYRQDFNLNVAKGSYLLQLVTENGIATRKLELH